MIINHRKLICYYFDIHHTIYFVVILLLSPATVAYATTDANGGDSVITEKVFISEVNCDGSENLLTGCDHIYEGVPITCNNVNYAGAVCQQGQSLAVQSHIYNTTILTVSDRALL